MRAGRAHGWPALSARNAERSLEHTTGEGEEYLIVVLQGRGTLVCAADLLQICEGGLPWGCHTGEEAMHEDAPHGGGRRRHHNAQPVNADAEAGAVDELP